MIGFYIKELRVTGAGKKNAAVIFDLGLNVISGASDTGKSYIFSCIEFMLGKEESPKPIPEAIGYTDVYLEIRNIVDDSSLTLHRKFQDTMVQMKRCPVDDYMSSKVDMSSFPIRHNPKSENNLSRFLLKECNLDGKQLKTSKENKKASLTFTDIRKMTCIHEERIITEESPFYYDSQYTLQTKNQSFLKYILTGHDDSLLKTEEKVEITETKLRSKIEVLSDQLELKHEHLREIESSLTIANHTPAEEEIEILNISLLQTNGELENLGAKRNEIFGMIQQASKSLFQKRELLNRFQLLTKHYKSDLDRLHFVEEGGDFLNQLDNQKCPVCFQEMNSEHEHQISSNNKIVIAIQAETQKIKEKLNDLKDTIVDLKEKISVKTIELGSLQEQHTEVQSKINDELNPKLDFIRSRLMKIVDVERNAAKKSVLVDEVEEIEERIRELEEDLINTSKGKKPSVRISSLYSDKLSSCIEKRLNSWKYDNNVKTKFDDSYSIFDVQIGNKLRKSYGKGKRGVSYAACVIGLSDYCKKFNRDYSHTIVLDSPLTAYESNKEQKGLNEVGADIVTSFYNDLSMIDGNRQIIILDNKNPGGNLKGPFNHVVFTGINGTERSGFFPVS
jgi:gas vesicle protein